jgi:hypothetical protein
MTEQSATTATVQPDAVDLWWSRAAEVLADDTLEILGEAAQHDAALPIVMVVNALDVSGLDRETYDRVIKAITAQAEAWGEGQGM